MWSSTANNPRPAAAEPQARRLPRPPAGAGDGRGQGEKLPTRGRKKRSNPSGLLLCRLMDTLSRTPHNGGEQARLV